MGKYIMNTTFLEAQQEWNSLLAQDNMSASDYVRSRRDVSDE
jgi:hypothetical protein